MNHANLKTLITQQNSHNNKLYYVTPHTDVRTKRYSAQTDDLVVNFWSGAVIVSHPDGSWHLYLDTNSLSVFALEALNLCTGPNFCLKKHSARKFSINGEDFIGETAEILFDKRGDFHYQKGILSGKDLEAGKKELHKLTRRIRKKVQPQLRLLGTGHFQKKPSDKQLYWSRGAEKEIEVLMDLLDGKDVVENLDLLRCLCDMDNLFGNGSRWGSNTSDFQPKKIIDKILRRVSAHKIAILEKYDERRSTAN